jgi:choline dehydrogenase
MLKTNHTNTGDRDILIFSGPFAFRAFYPPEANVSLPADPFTIYGLSVVRMNPASHAGTVKLRSANPTDTPDINFNYFKGPGANDLQAMADVSAWAREMYTHVGGPWGPIDTLEPPCSAGQSCRAIDEQWIKDQAWGHHATSTCTIGKPSNQNAVVDSKLRVKGVKGLRVVDASAFPRTPGAFPVVSTFMLSEKASADVLGALASQEIVDVDQEVQVTAADEL